MADKNQDVTTDNCKSEDPAKMTYSIPDFVSQDPRILPRLREHLTQNQDPDLESYESRIVDSLTRGEYTSRTGAGLDPVDRLVQWAKLESGRGHVRRRS